MAIDKLNNNSSFWLERDFFKSSKSDDMSISMQRNLKLLSYKRSISNFVKILTRKDNIKVSFSSGQQSYTDGRSVVISSKINENNFDVTVGLALHEASHVLLTDFNFIQKRAKLNEVLADELGKDFLDYKSKDYEYIHVLHNIVEDRYIDEYVYTNAPGYRGYYNALYDFYFRKESLTKWLKLPKKRVENFDNYKDQLLNIVNTKFDINCMPGMPALVKELDLPNIMRLTTTEMRLRLAIRLYLIIKNHVNNPVPVKVNNKPIVNTQQSQQPASSKNEDISEENLDNVSDFDASPDDDATLEDLVDTEDNSAQSSNKGFNSKPEESEELTSKEEQEISDMNELIGKFLEGKLTEDEDNSKLESKINALEQANAKELISYVTLSNGQKIAVKGILVNHISESLIEAGLFTTFLDRYKYDKYKKDPNQQPGPLDIAINNGMLLGKQLAKKIMVRNEEKTFITNRLNDGKIFNRHVALLGADVENIFYKTRTDKFKKSIIHISIDASGSMSGLKFNNSIQMAVAVAKACTYLRDVNCVINLRGQEGQFTPCTMIIYNSKVDHISKIYKLFPYLSCNSGTPEGLCYDIYSKFISDSDNDSTDKYLINLSDGEPAFSLKGAKESYGGDLGIKHSREAWSKIIKLGVTGLSYFITDSDMSNIKIEKTDFGKIYGKDSKFIEANNLTQLARTINDMLISKEALMSI
jgi:hypothetical protein